MEDIKKLFLRFAGSRDSVLLCLAVLGFVLFAVFSSPSREYPVIFSVERGAGLSQVADMLEGERIIRYRAPFMACSLFMDGGKNIKAGVYELFQKTHPCRIAYKLVEGDYGLVAMSITIPEGTSVEGIAERFSDFPYFDKERFLKDAPEGYLFPDTYFVFPDITDREVLSLMSENFDRRMLPIMEEVEKSGRTLKEIITMASIIEGEANSPESRRMVSGILWERMRLGIALQVDATFAYVNGKNTYQLSLMDLEIDSPYNTYRYRGLPPTPISNPGMDSIEAALRPTESDYLYFLSDLAGNMYYAEDFDGHQHNRERYLRR